MDQGLQSKHYTAWQLITAYWRSEHKMFAYLLFSSIIAITLLLVGMDVIFNYWYNHFYNALQAYDKSSAISLLIIFMFLAAIFIVISVYRYYMTQFFGLRWRQWMTNEFIKRWLEKRSYYYLENFDKNTDNPDQRIQEDAAAIVTYTLDLVVGLIGAVTTFFSFILILWSLSGTLRIPIGHFQLVIQGDLVWVSIIYSLIGTYIAFKIGYPLVPLNFEQQRREASFRFAAIDLRTHSEHVALYRGEGNENTILRRLFGRVLENYYMIILRQKFLLWFTAGYNQMAIFLPLLVALPNYFSKVFLLGGLMQSLRAFASIQDALSFLLNSYTTIASWRAVLARLLTFLNHIADVEQQALQHNQFTYEKGSDPSIVAKEVNIFTPDGKPLLEKINQTFVPGSHYLLKGPSGIGKSTLIRTIAGIWPFGNGEIKLPMDQKILYVPQKSYVPLGSLKEALLFPENLNTVSDEAVTQALIDCHLENLATRIYDTESWAELLSPGELQRLIFARILIHKPDWLFLDETTSSLDLANEEYLYNLLKVKLPKCTIISVGHHTSIDTLHDHIIDIGQYSVAAA